MRSQMRFSLQICEAFHLVVIGNVSLRTKPPVLQNSEFLEAEAIVNPSLRTANIGDILISNLSVCCALQCVKTGQVLERISIDLPVLYVATGKSASIRQ
jgi:hypothetical protein